VVITGPNTEGVPELASTLNLDSEKDMICVDASLKTFQALALIDGNPIYDKTMRRYTFPQSFGSSGKIIHDSDVMHGLFIVDPKGFVVSSRRAFMAEDDTEQLLADIKFAQNVPAALKADRASPAPAAAKTTSSALHNVDRINLKRQIFRYQKFKDLSK
jgi:hypothetical protein